MRDERNLNGNRHGWTWSNGKQYGHAFNESGT
jgi:hypothetical protein